MKRLGTLGLGLALLWGTAARAADTVYYYYTDEQGTPEVMADAQGNVVERTQYAPYGQVLNRPEHDGPGYTGHEEDAATGLTNMQQRYADKVIGRMDSTDPLDVDPNTGANFNKYAYANDNPYKFTDPDGRQAAATDCGTNGCFPNPERKEELDTPVSTAGENVRTIVYDDSYRRGANSGSHSSSGAGQAATAGTATTIAAGTAEETGKKLLPEVIAENPLAALAAALTSLLSGDTPQTQYVVRGGLCAACNFSGGSGVTLDANGNLQGVSVQSFPGTSVQQLSQRQWVPNNQIGVATMQSIERQGGYVTPAPTRSNPYHAILSGVTPAQAQMLFTPTIPNPNPKPEYP